MKPHDIYQRLWSANDDKEFAQSIIDNPSLSPFLRTWALLKLGKKGEAKANFKNLPLPAGDELEEMLYEELWLLFNSSNLKPVEFKERLTVIVKRFPYSIWGKITLAHILEAREVAYARDLYTAVLDLCPSNPNATVGFIQASIRLGDQDKAFLMLRESKQKRILASLSTRRKVYWGTILGVYRVMIGEMVGIRLFLVMFVFLAGFFMPTTIVVPITFFVIGILLGLYFISDMLASLFFFSHAFFAILVYFAGYGAKVLFTLLESL